jgi:hypothetical protein
MNMCHIKRSTSMSPRICDRPHQQGHVAHSENDKCQDESTFMVCENHKSE